LFSWSANGHQTVGAIADGLIKGHNAEKQVQSILGKSGITQLNLSLVSVWPDCVRSVQATTSGALKWQPSQEDSAACKIFEDDSGKKSMEDYATRNNSNCPYEDKNLYCHKAFHFADVGIQHSDYKTTYQGTHNYDVVHAINAAIAVLQGATDAPTPFNIKGKKEALMLLTHFVGDVHQPLHVAAIYLDSTGNIVNPDQGTFNSHTDTHGGNSIDPGSNNLHHRWDETKYTFTAPAGLSSLISSATKVTATSGKITDWSTAWASDTVSLGKKAFGGLTFTGAPKDTWSMTFEDQKQYDANLKTMQTEQVAKAGARLAAMLEAIWPD
jgi:hypothetical protein